jgi:phosphatidate phosphatase LPIN
MMVFGRPLETKVINELEAKESARLQQSKKGWRSWLTWGSKNREQQAPPKPPTSNPPPNPPTIAFRRSLRPSAEQLAAMNLHPGSNQVRFVVTSKLQGTREVRATIYLWDKDDKIVISDIDGTITKSDVFGQILPIMGKDWSHSGVVQLYSNIKKNHYHLLYLTARPIGQASSTRGYISRLKQGDVLMPSGPVICSPDRLLTSFNREVIQRKPEEFKIECLRDIRDLFPKGSKPFYAGFGNRPTDALSYRAVDIPLGKIFTINYTGEINIVNHTYRKT